ncbi:MAG: hypothetical protein GF313_17430 [Caldithrix sp.]|nr:hypothetical protein [Caldithrix sp.]
MDYYTYVMKNYFRKMPPVSTPEYLDQDLMDDADVRKQVAQHCHFPSIINVLANDPDEEVRTAARRNEYWQLLGQYQDVLGFEKRERMEFAKIEGEHNLVLLLMFEDDLEVIKEALSNSSLTVKMLALYFQLLSRRGQGKKDQQLYELARTILQERKSQIIKISQMHRAIREISVKDTFATIIRYLGDDNPMVRKATRNALNALKTEIINDIIFACLSLSKEQLNKNSFVAINELIKICTGREDLRKLSVDKLSVSKKAKLSKTYSSAAELFMDLLNKQRYKIASLVSEDTTNLENLVINALCHTDQDRHLKELADRNMSMEDLMQLVNEPSVPRRYFKEILSILGKHPDKNVAEMVRNSYMNETKRMKKKLQELEMSVEAYFDIIFQSVGYNKINEYKAAINAINSAERQIKKFDSLWKTDSVSHMQMESNNMQDIKSNLKKQAAQIYYDTSPKIMQELEYIDSSIEEIFQLREIGLLSIRPGTPEDVESELRAKGRTIWQSAISSYLGRIKDLSEMLQKKIECLNRKEYNDEILMSDLDLALKELEGSYKKTINCHLKIPCKQCSKRGCASERFLREVRFLIDVIFDDISPQSTSYEVQGEFATTRLE